MAYAWAVYTHALMLAGRWGERPPVARALLITSALQLGALVAAAVTECLRAPSAGEAAVLKQALLSGGSSGAVPAEALSTDPRRKRQRPWRAPPAGTALKEPSAIFECCWAEACVWCIVPLQQRCGALCFALLGAMHLLIPGVCVPGRLLWENRYAFVRALTTVAYVWPCNPPIHQP